MQFSVQANGTPAEVRAEIYAAQDKADLENPSGASIHSALADYLCLLIDRDAQSVHVSATCAAYIGNRFPEPAAVTPESAQNSAPPTPGLGAA